MASAIQAATSADDLRRIEDPAISYRFREIFAGGGRGRAGRERLRLLKQLEGPLAGILDEKEVVLFLCRAGCFHGAEAWLMGSWAWLLKRRAVIVTTRRVLLLEIDRRGRLTGLGSQFRREAVERVTAPLGPVQIRFRDGDSLRIALMASADGKRLRRLLGSETERETAPRSAVRGLEHLCPHCRAVLHGVPESCPHCRGSFCSPERAAWLALLLPGLGEWYLGNHLIGGYQAGSMLFVWGILIASPVPRTSPFVAVLAAVALFAFGHGLQALATGVVARKWIYPLARARRGDPGRAG